MVTLTGKVGSKMLVSVIVFAFGMFISGFCFGRITA